MKLLEQSINSARNQNDLNTGLIFLATSGTDAQPRIRTLLLRKIEDRRLLILFSRFHHKWSQLQENPQVEVLLWYPSIGHQYRIQGAVVEASPSESAACWAEQPNFIKRVDLAYSDDFLPSRSIDDPVRFHEKVRSLTDEYVIDVPPPDHVIAAWIVAQRIERLVSSPDRLHDRVQYLWERERWQMQRLIP